MHNQCFYTKFTAISLAQHFYKGFASKLTGLWQQSVFKSKLPASVVSVPVPRNYFFAWLWLSGGESFLLSSDSKHFLSSPALLGYEMQTFHYPPSLPKGRLWWTHWALANNASKHSLWRYSYLPSYMIQFSSRLHEYHLCAETPPWGTGSALLM